MCVLGQSCFGFGLKFGLVNSSSVMLIGLVRGCTGWGLNGKHSMQLVQFWLLTLVTHHSMQ